MAENIKNETNTATVESAANTPATTKTVSDTPANTETVSNTSATTESVANTVADSTAKTETNKAKTKVQVVEKPAPNPTNLTDLVEQIKKSGTISEKTLVANIESYMENMAPGKPVNPEDGDKYQYQLWKTIYNLIHNVPVEEFRKLWNILLMFFKQNKNGVFHDRYLFRFSEYWVHSLEELNAFQRILNLINLTCDPATRQLGLRQVDLDRTLAEGFSEEDRQRIISFYRL